jgi:hypothetical protein
VFVNDGSFQLVVKGLTPDGGLFEPFKEYDITVHHEISHTLFRTLHAKDKSSPVYSKLGVITRHTRNSVHIACGSTHWMFPKRICALKPGIDVWISVAPSTRRTNATHPSHSWAA